MSTVVIGGTRHVTVVLGGDNSVLLRAATPGPAVIAEVGKVGPAGRDGTTSTFTFVQETPVAVWVITHNLGYAPAGVFVSDIDGDDVIGDIEHTDLNTTTITFSEPISGTAYLS
jgi:hypothetical protein